MKLAQTILIFMLLLYGLRCMAAAQEPASTGMLRNSGALCAHEDCAMPLPASGEYFHRGDWETPDRLLVVDDLEWRPSIKTIVEAALRDEISVSVLVGQRAADQKMQKWIKQKKTAAILQVPHDTPWIRDYGPFQINHSDGSVRWIDFDYSSERPFDDLVPRELAKAMNMSIDDGHYYLEGGALISNGRGLCAMTMESLEEAPVDIIDPEAFETFRHALGCKVLAVVPALTGESTGHADIFAQFLAPHVAAVAIVDEHRFPDIADELDKVVLLLRAAAKAMDQTLRIVRLPMHIEDDVFYSYVNGTRLKKAYLVPSFEDVPVEMERDAYLALETVLPGIRLVPVPADSMVQRGGAVHCITLGLSLAGSDRSGHYLVKEEKAVPAGTASGMTDNENAGAALPEKKEDKTT